MTTAVSGCSLLRRDEANRREAERGIWRTREIRDPLGSMVDGEGSNAHDGTENVRGAALGGVKSAHHESAFRHGLHACKGIALGFVTWARRTRWSRPREIMETERFPGKR